MAKPSPDSYHHGDLRQALLQAGADLLEERGTDDISLRELARRAGVSHNAPYRHFPDRDALLDALAAEGFRSLDARMRATTAATPADRLAALGQAYVAAALERPGRFALMFRVTPSPAAFPETAAAAPMLMRTFREAVAAVAGDPTDAVASATAWAAVHGLAHLLLQGHLGAATQARRATGPDAGAADLVAAVTQRLASTLGSERHDAAAAAPPPSGSPRDRRTR